MENLDFIKWISPGFFIGVFCFILYLFIEYKRDGKKEGKLESVKERVTKINLQLLKQGMTYGQIMDFWEECVAEAEIQHQLPRCTCSDVNECETWCQAKARFVMNPPEEKAP